MDRKDHVILRKDYLLLQFKYVKLKEEGGFSRRSRGTGS